MPLPGGTAWDYTPGQMADLSKLGYSYDDLSPAMAAIQPADRLLRLGASAEVVKAAKGVRAVATGKNVELVGANQGALKITGSEAHTSVKLDPGVRNKVVASLNRAKTAGMAETTTVPDRVFLNLENVRGFSDATGLKVYIDLPAGAKPAAHPERLAGSVSLFGANKASLTDDEHAGNGLNLVLEITDLVDALHLNKKLDVNSLDVRIVPRRPVPEDAEVSIGRVSIFRQGQ
jgi:tyrosinase